MSALLSVITAAVACYVILYYGVFRRARCSSSAKLKGKTAIVTGNEPHLQAAVPHIPSVISVSKL